MPIESHLFHSTQRPHVDKIGRCIYCREFNDKGLTKEHVMPHGMGGGIILREACCPVHQKIINDEFENDVLSNLFGPIRHQHGMPSRNERPTHFEARVVRNGVSAVEKIPLDLYPDTLTLPVLQNPPAILNRLPACPVSIGQIRTYRNEGENKRKLLQLGADAIIFEPKFHPDRFIRWLAKVAHGVAVANEGMTFEPLLIDLIEGIGVEHAGLFIGSQIAEIPPAKGHAHSVATTHFKYEDDEILVVTVRLFGEFDTPAYSIVTGRLN